MESSIYTTAEPFTPMWWFEIYSHALARDVLAVERMQWNDAKRYGALKRFCYSRFQQSLNRAIDIQQYNCSREYLESTYDSNNFEYKGKPLRNYVHDLIRHAKKPDIK